MKTRMLEPRALEKKAAESRGGLWWRVAIITAALLGLTTVLILNRSGGSVTITPGSSKPSPIVTPSGDPTSSPSPSVDPRSEWKAFATPGNEWRFRYPPDWRIDGGGRVALWHLLNPLYPADAPGHGGLPPGAVKIDFSVNTDTELRSLEDARKDSCEPGLTSNYYEVLSCGFEEIQGLKWVQLYGRGTDAARAQFLRLLTVRDGAAYVALANFGPGKAKADLALVREIFSTFELGD